MESAVPSGGTGARRNEDIALDLLRFVVMSTGFGRGQSSSAGFVSAAGSRPEEHVDQILALYSKCLRTVEGK